MAILFKTLADNTYLRRTVLVWGEPGAGKTSLARSFGTRLRKDANGKPDWKRILYVAGDPGWASIADLADVSVFRPFKDGKPNDLLAALAAGQSKDFDLIFVDGVDKISNDVLLAFTEAEEKKPKPDLRGMWGDFGKAMRKWLLGMRDLDGANVVFTTHASVDEDGDPRFRPAWAGGKVREELSGMFDFCLHMKFAKLSPTTPPERCFITQRAMDKVTNGDYTRYDVKSRVPANRPALPVVMKADLDLLWKHLFD